MENMQQFVEIITHDTGDTYLFGQRAGDRKESPPKEYKKGDIYKVSLQIGKIDSDGCVRKCILGIGDESYTAKSVYLTKKTLEDAGCIMVEMHKKSEFKPERKPEDLIIELLDMLGYIPAK